jgi:DNA topoisomerase-3
VRLFLCEKPSQGKDIARVLGATQRGNGCLTGPNVCVTWCIGHLLEACPPETYDERYKSWSLEHLPIIPQTWKVEVKTKTASQFKVVKKLIHEASELVIATDADREGELIAREIMEFCDYRGPVQRLWLSALNPESIRKALAELKSNEDTFRLYHAALARSRADWLIGMNLTRLFTLVARRCGHDQVMPVGRVQTPTLYLAVMRERAIEAFVKKPFWEIDVQLEASGKSFVAKWQPATDSVDSEGRCINRIQAERALAGLRSGQATINHIDVEWISERPPLPFDMAGLQEQCDRQFAMGVEETLNIAQSLYETHKATHYPRTECSYLPESMLPEVPTVLAALAKTDPSIVGLLSKLDPQQRSHAWDDKKLTGPHHGIIPTTEAADIDKMSEKERLVYDLIRRRYMAQFMPHHEYNRTTAILTASGMTLKAVGKQVTVSGWKALFGGDKDAEDDEPEKTKSQILPPLESGHACTIRDALLKSLTTTPPRRFTEGTLLKAMKNIAETVEDPRLKAKLKATTGIGTQATRATIIKGLLQRDYLLKKGRSLVPTPSAFALIDCVPALVKDPGMTAIWEQASDEIEAGRMPLDTFLSGQSAWISRLVEQCSKLTLNIDQPQTPPCPKCGATMRRKMGKKGVFLSCSQYPACDGIVSLTPVKKVSRKAKRPTE